MATKKGSQNDADSQSLRDDELIVDLDVLEAAAPRPEHHPGDACECELCRTRRPFDLPDQLVQACLDGDLVIFAGAGVSTENRTVLPFTLYEDVSAELELEPDLWPSFPTVMQIFEERFGRPALLTRIRKRIDHVGSFQELDHLACRFHHELATLFPVSDIFTTNWDLYFERECGATSYLTEADWAFWRYQGRKVFKLHGSIANPGSIVATEEDYRRCYRRLNRGILGATLKTMLATKTVVFIGYSFGDSDFNAIYSTLRRQMGAVLPRAYMVNPTVDGPPAAAKDLHVIQTDGTYFIEQLKAALPEEEFVDDVRLEAVPVKAAYVRHLHSKLLSQRKFHEYPETLYAASYQDGLLHAFDHQRTNRSSGMYSHRCNVEAWIEMYEGFRGNALRAKHYNDVAYIEGYLAGLQSLLVPNPSEAPFRTFYVFGHKGVIETFEEYVPIADQAEKLHKTSYRNAERLARRYWDGLDPHHRVLLPPSVEDGYLPA